MKLYFRTKAKFTFETVLCTVTRRNTSLTVKGLSIVCRIMMKFNHFYSDLIRASKARK